jgi:hypothetical protein
VHDTDDSANKNGTTTLSTIMPHLMLLRVLLIVYIGLFKIQGLEGQPAMKFPIEMAKIFVKRYDENLRFIEKNNNTKDANVKGLFVFIRFYAW